jgi:hypothetical protein
MKHKRRKAGPSITVKIEPRWWLVPFLKFLGALWSHHLIGKPLADKALRFVQRHGVRIRPATRPS